MKIAANPTLRWTGCAISWPLMAAGGQPAGSTPLCTALVVKYIANRLAKNISSEDNQMIVPTLIMFGRVSDPCDGIFSSADAVATRPLWRAPPVRTRGGHPTRGKGGTSRGAQGLAGPAPTPPGTVRRDQAPRGSRRRPAGAGQGAAGRHPRRGRLRRGHPRRRTRPTPRTSGRCRSAWSPRVTPTTWSRSMPLLGSTGLRSPLRGGGTSLAGQATNAAARGRHLAAPEPAALPRRGGAVRVGRARAGQRPPAQRGRAARAHLRPRPGDLRPVHRRRQHRQQLLRRPLGRLGHDLGQRPPARAAAVRRDPAHRRRHARPGGARTHARAGRGHLPGPRRHRRHLRRRDPARPARPAAPGLGLHPRRAAARAGRPRRRCPGRQRGHLRHRAQGRGTAAPVAAVPVSGRPRLPRRVRRGRHRARAAEPGAAGARGHRRPAGRRPAQQRGPELRARPAARGRVVPVRRAARRHARRGRATRPGRGGCSRPAVPAVHRPGRAAAGLAAARGGAGRQLARAGRAAEVGGLGGLVRRAGQARRLPARAACPAGGVRLRRLAVLRPLRRRLRAHPDPVRLLATTPESLPTNGSWTTRPTWWSSYGGSLSGEHGDGQQRAHLLGKMYGPELLRRLRRVQGARGTRTAG